MGSSSDKWHEEQDYSSLQEYEFDQLGIMVDKLIQLANHDPEWIKKKLKELIKAIHGGKVTITFDKDDAPKTQ